jgi:hypothetical protein
MKSSMRKLFCIFELLFSVLLIRQSVAEQKMPVSSLCKLQMQVMQGKHQSVLVEGVYLSGVNGASYLINPECSITSTYVDFDLKTHKNFKKLQKLLDSGKRGGVIGDAGAPVLVLFEGEFYGPPIPDPKLPEWVRKIYHPTWDNDNFTKLVVRSIRNVQLLPADHPCASTKSDKWPCYQRNVITPQNNSNGDSTGTSNKPPDTKSSPTTSP